MFIRIKLYTTRHCNSKYDTQITVKTSISCCWRTRATRCITANTLQTKVDAQCDKLVTELRGQRLRRSTFSSHSELSKVANFIIPHLHLVPPFGWSLWVLPRSSASENSLGYRVALFAWLYTCRRFSRTPTCDRQTDRQSDGHKTTAYSALALRRAVKINE